MFTRLKTKSRRCYHDVIHQVIKTEKSAEQIDFDKAKEKFKSLERTIKTILANVKVIAKDIKTLSENSAKLSCLLMTEYSSDRSENSVKDHATLLAQNINNNQKAVEEASKLLLENQVVDPIEKLLEFKFLDIRKRLKRHKDISKDLDIYRRRMKKMEQNSIPSHEREYVKLEEKLNRTQASYEALHVELLDEMNDLHDSRHEIFRPYFIAMVVWQGGFHVEFAKCFNIFEDMDINIETMHEYMLNNIKKQDSTKSISESADTRQSLSAENEEYLYSDEKPNQSSSEEIKQGLRHSGTDL